MEGKHKDWKIMNEAWRKALKEVEMNAVRKHQQKTLSNAASKKLTKGAAAGTAG